MTLGTGQSDFYFRGSGEIMFMKTALHITMKLL